MAPHRRPPRLPAPGHLRPRGAPHPECDRPAPAHRRRRCARSARRRPRPSPTRPRRPGWARWPIWPTPRSIQDLLDRERSVIAGHTDVEFTGLITVTAPNPDTARRGPGGGAAGRGAGRLRRATALWPPGPGVHPGRPAAGPHRLLMRPSPPATPEPIPWGSSHPAATPMTRAAGLRPGPGASAGAALVCGSTAGGCYGLAGYVPPGPIPRRCGRSCGRPASSRSSIAAG